MEPVKQAARILVLYSLAFVAAASKRAE